MEIMDSRKSGAAVFIVMALLAVAVFLLQRQSGSETALEGLVKSTLPQQINDQHVAPSISVVATSNEAPPRDLSTDPEWPTVLGSPQNAAEINGWLGSRGYKFGSGNFAEYESYNQETLITLANQGDPLAMTMLGDSVLGTIGGFEKAKDAYFGAAVYGSSAALDTIGLTVKHFVYSNAVTSEEKKAAALEILAWYNTAALRGDMYPNTESARHFIKMEKIELTEMDKQHIKTRSQAIYDKLAEIRKERGLGDFDNSVPASVIKYIDLTSGPHH